MNVDRGFRLVMASTLMLFLLLQISTTSGNTANCIDNYNDFVNLTFSHGHVNGTENRWKLYEAFYEPNHRLPFSVLVLYQAMLPNGTTENITIQPCTIHSAWAWISSPVFMLIRAEYLNLIALLTLNHFRHFYSPPITITVPQPCQKQKYKLLSIMTSQVST